jgi:type IV pilus assembly protein PilE
MRNRAEFLARSHRKVARRSPVNHRDSTRGFTLIELMIAVAIVGILSALAYPSYVAHVQKAKRAEAESVMLEAVQWLQRYYVAHNGYTDADTALATTDYATSPKGSSGSAVVYNITLEIPSNSNQAYTLTADLAVANDADSCGSLTLDHTGAKGQSATGATAAKCWR